MTRTMLPLLAVTLGVGAGCFEKIDILAGTTPTTPTDGGVRDTARVPCGTGGELHVPDAGIAWNHTKCSVLTCSCYMPVLAGLRPMMQCDASTKICECHENTQFVTGTTSMTECTEAALLTAWTTGCGYPEVKPLPTPGVPSSRTCAFPKDPFGNIAAIAGVQQCVNGFWSDCSVDCKAPAGTTHPCLTCALATCPQETSAVICTKYRDLYCQLLGASTTCNVIGVAINACTSPALEQAYCGGANPVACTAVRCNAVCDVERKTCDALNPPYPQCRDAEDVCNAACEAKSPLLTTLNTLLTCSKAKCSTECGASAQKWLEVGRSICKITPPTTKPDAGIVGRPDATAVERDVGPVHAPDAPRPTPKPDAAAKLPDSSGDPCAGVVCKTPPAACVGATLRTYSPGTCNSSGGVGVCSYPFTDMNCGFGCSAGACNACVPETDASFCAAAKKDCGLYVGLDGCGDPRAANCGLCLTPATCSQNQCL